MSVKKSLIAVTAAAVTAVSGAAMAPAAQARPVPAPGYCNYTDNEPVLEKGDTGTEVVQLQCQLNIAIRRYQLGYAPLALDGQFGQLTKNVVVAYQRHFHLDPNGVVGRYTWASLDQNAL